MPDATTSPTTPASGPQTDAALVAIDHLPPLPTPPACLSMSPWDMMRLTQEDLRTLRRFEDECRAYSHQIAALVADQTTKLALEVIQRIEGYLPDVQALETGVTRIEVRSPDDACEPCTRFYWQGQAILDVQMQWRTSDEHPSPSMHIKVLA